MLKITMLIGRLSIERNPIPFQLAEELSKNGFKVEVIGGYPSRGIRQEAINKYKSVGSFQPINENLSIRRVGSKRRDKGSLFRRATDYLKLTYAIYKEAKDKETDAYLIYSSPPFLMLLTGRLRKRAPIVLNIQDLFPYSLLALLSRNLRFILEAPLVSLMKRSYRKSDGIITVSDDMKASLTSMGLDHSRVDVAYNWVNLSNVYNVPDKENPLFEEFGLDISKKYVVYAGNLGKFQAIDRILELARVSLELNSEFQYLIFGEGTEKAKIAKYISDAQLTNVTLLPLQPPEKVKYVYSLGKFNVLSLQPGVICYAHPSKTAYLLATGVPILAFLEPSCELSKFIKENSLGMVIPNQANDEILVNALRKMDDFDTAVKDERAKHFPGTYEGRYSLERSAQIYGDAVYKCIDRYRNKK